MKFRIKQHPDAGPFTLDWFHENYKTLNYKDQVVLDIGADWGRTADYFLQKGAKHVIAVEGKKEWYDLLEENSKIIEGITPVFIWLKSPNDLSNLIKTYKPDIIKISTWPWTACENWLMKIPDELFLSIPKYIFMSSDGSVQEKPLKHLLKRFRKLGYTVNKRMTHIPIVTAVLK